MGNICSLKEWNVGMGNLNHIKSVISSSDNILYSIHAILSAISQESQYYQYIQIVEKYSCLNEFTPSLLMCLENIAYSQEGREKILHLYIWKTLLTSYILPLVDSSDYQQSCAEKVGQPSEQSLLSILSIRISLHYYIYLMNSEYDSNSTEKS